MKIKLNLIPPYKRAEIKKSRTLRMILGYELELTFVFIIFLLLLLSANYILRINLNLATEELDITKKSYRYSDIAKYNEEAIKTNKQLNVLEKIQKEQLYWSKLFIKINDITSNKIVFTDISSDNFTVLLIGKSETRDELVIFKDTLEKEVCFSNIKMPLSNLVSREDVDFRIELEVEEECIKNL